MSKLRAETQKPQDKLGAFAFDVAPLRMGITCREQSA